MLGYLVFTYIHT